MKTRKINQIDVHTAIARARASRAEYFRTALTQLAGLLKRHAQKSRPSRMRAVRFGAWA